MLTVAEAPDDLDAVGTRNGRRDWTSADELHLHRGGPYRAGETLDLPKPPRYRTALAQRVREWRRLGRCIRARLPTFYWGQQVFWFRVTRYGPGFIVKSGRPFFSERMGFDKPVARIGRFRLFWLERYEPHR